MLLLSLGSCEKIKGDTTIIRDVNVCVSDAAGNDLLNPESTSANVIKEVKIYDIYKGDTTLLEHYDKSDHFAQLFTVNDGNVPVDSYYVKVYGKFRKNQETAKILLEWGNGMKDIMEIEYEKDSDHTYYESVKKVFLSGLQVFGPGVENPYRCVIIKH